MTPARLARGLRNWMGSVAVLALLGAGAGAAFVVPAALAAPSTGEESDAIQAARAKADAGDIAGAVEDMRALVRAAPDDATARKALADLYLRAGDPQGAEKEYRAAMERGAAFETVLDGLGLAILLQGNDETLLKQFEAANYAGETAAKIHLFRAQAHLALTEIDRAREEVDKAQAAAPDFDGTILAVSQMQQIDGKAAEAEATVDALLARDPANLEALLQKGELRGAAGDPAAALALFERVLSERENDTRARLGKVASLITLGRAAEAEPEIDAVIAVRPNNPLAAYFKALVLAQRGARDEALTLLTDTRGMDRVTPALLLLASLQLQAGNLDQAQRQADLYLARVPGDVAGRTLHAAVRLARGEVSQAIAALEALKAERPEDFGVVSLLGSAYLEMGRYAEAAEQFAAASSQLPANEIANLGLAYSLAGQGKPAESMQSVEALIAANPASGQARFLLILLHFQNGEIDKARAVANDFVAATNGIPVALQLRAAAAMTAGDRGAARKDLEAAIAKDASFLAAKLGLAEIDRIEGDLAGARALYEEVLKTQPGNLGAHIGLAQVELASGNLDGTLSQLARAGNAAPENPLPGTYAVQVLLDAGQAARALSEARALVSKFPDEPMALDVLGQAQLAGGDTGAAIQTFQRVATRSPNSPIPQVRLAGAYLAADRKPEAKAALDAALALAPKAPATNGAMVDFLFRTEGAEAGIAFAEEARSRVAPAPEGTLLLANAYLAGGKADRAAPLYAELWQTQPSASYLARYMAALEALGQRDEAAAVARSWLARVPNDTAALLALMVNRVTAKDWPAAAAAGEKILTLRPDDVPALNNLALVYADMGDAAKGLTLAEKAHKLAPEAPAVWDTYGWLLVRSGRLDEGLVWLQKALATAPEFPEYAYHTAVALKQKGDTAEAARLVDIALKGDAPYPWREEAMALKAALQGN